MVKIVINDDEALVRETLLAMLEADGHQVFAATNSEEALGLVAQHNPQLLITDIVVPKKCGFELIENLKKNPQHASLRILAISGSLTGVGEYLELAKSLGAHDVLYKPFSKAELSDKLQTLL